MQRVSGYPNKIWEMGLNPFDIDIFERIAHNSRNGGTHVETQVETAAILGCTVAQVNHAIRKLKRLNIVKVRAYYGSRKCLIVRPEEEWWVPKYKDALDNKTRASTTPTRGSLYNSAR